MGANSASLPEESEPGPRPAIVSEKPAAEPRLSIVHLMVATVCVALYAAVTRVYIAALPDSGAAYQAILAGMGSVGGGLALAGLLLVPARRRRGLRFPRHPGEYLVFLLGVDVVLVLLWWSLFLLADALNSQPWDMIVAFYLVQAVTLAGFYVYCIVRVKLRRWRVFFVSGLVGLFFWFGTRFSVSPSPTFFQLLPFAPDALLAIVVTMDLIQRRRYPWSHWLGVVTKLWLSAVSLIWLISFWLSSEPPG